MNATLLMYHIQHSIHTTMERMFVSDWIRMGIAMAQLMVLHQLYYHIIYYHLVWYSTFCVITDSYFIFHQGLFGRLATMCQIGSIRR